MKPPFAQDNSNDAIRIVTLNESPSQHGEDGGRGSYLTHYKSPLGDITLASDGQFLIGLWFEGQRHIGTTLSSDHTVCDELPVFHDTRRWLDIYFSGHDPGFTPPLLLCTTPFRKQVGEVMLSIPFGKTMTYGEIARLIAQEQGLPSMSAQAVGNAVGHNPISLIVPCHRVIGSNGSLTGYAAGIDRKLRLLQLEGIKVKG